MNFGGDATQHQDVDPEPGWSGLYDPWNGRRRGTAENFPEDELYYSRELSDNEDDDNGPRRPNEARDGEEHEVSSPSPIPCPSPPMRGLSPIWGPSPERSPSRLWIPFPARSPSPLRSPRHSTVPPPRPHYHVNIEDIVPGQPYAFAIMVLPVPRQGRRRRDEEDFNQEAPPSSRRRVDPDGEVDFISRPVQISVRMISALMREM
ncbi:uncharacterized protein LOC113653928 isoform X1 [Tachysurus fulvidraco]|uniref:uncharacterized protein LOC113653928 isoform X1 n=1 Tax=Tachysurus fulvidraco TaxID=1234273 RepID=UPI000F5055AE|nr:uncharacterized protein LOC113653928 isoform X1 [Tachysurus fulvidraco]